MPAGMRIWEERKRKTAPISNPTNVFRVLEKGATDTENQSFFLFSSEAIIFPPVFYFWLLFLSSLPNHFCFLWFQYIMLYKIVTAYLPKRLPCFPLFFLSFLRLALFFCVFIMYTYIIASVGKEEIA